jgi:act minimal PKS acyl carrier protein
MPTFTLDDLRAIMRRAAGAEDASRLDDDSADTPFADLGYDSLAVLDVAARIQEDFRVRLSDDIVDRFVTPGDAVKVVNELLAGGAA